MFELSPIGIVHTDVKDDTLRQRGSIEGRVEVYPEFVKGLDMLEGFSHLILITFLDKVDTESRKVLKVRFRHLQQAGVPFEILPEVGVFASDSPHRPNPIGLSIIQVVRFEGQNIHVLGLDVYEGTPVIDIKPYTPFRRVDDIRVPDWFSRIVSYIKKEP